MILFCIDFWYSLLCYLGCCTWNSYSTYFWHDADAGRLGLRKRRIRGSCQLYWGWTLYINFIYIFKGGYRFACWKVKEMLDKKSSDMRYMWYVWIRIIDLFYRWGSLLIIDFQFGFIFNFLEFCKRRYFNLTFDFIVSFLWNFKDPLTGIFCCWQTFYFNFVQPLSFLNHQMKPFSNIDKRLASFDYFGRL